MVLAFEEKAQTKGFFLHPYNNQDQGSTTLPIECDFGVSDLRTEYQSYRGERASILILLPSITFFLGRVQ
ncbi:hypothetical protein D0Y65_045269 [Glycine soja]|uniref:Uncharacterized protein n=1 Tax=Glycine soja TaxID=3848 RepID=A0A445G421_GLYSO|nr:hypothetical protein D0Y65_045269 [Glycine soja]RZB55932.1 hypothetical protein D0Y65_045269 [Glycine soja]